MDFEEAQLEVDSKQIENFYDEYQELMRIYEPASPKNQVVLVMARMRLNHSAKEEEAAFLCFADKMEKENPLFSKSEMDVVANVIRSYETSDDVMKFYEKNEKWLRHREDLFADVVITQILNIRGDKSTRGRWSREYRKTIFYILLINAIIMLLVHFLHQNIIFYNETESMKKGFYYNTFQDTPVRGDIVVYDGAAAHKDIAVNRGYSRDEKQRLQKRVAALEGDEWGVDEETKTFIVGYQDYGKALATDSAGRPLPQQFGRHTVKAGEFLPVGDHERSFDGRYTGTVPLENIVAIVKPVPFLTW